MWLKSLLLAGHCLTSGQTCETVKYKPELLVTVLLVTRDEQTTNETIRSS